MRHSPADRLCNQHTAGGEKQGVASAMQVEALKIKADSVIAVLKHPVLLSRQPWHSPADRLCNQHAAGGEKQGVASAMQVEALHKCLFSVVVVIIH